MLITESEECHHAVDVERLLCSMETALSSQSFSMCQDSCIFPIPNILRRHSQDAYVPTAFSIGPLHHHNASLKRTDRIKFKYLRTLVSRTGVALKDLILAVSKIEADSRKYYAEYLEFTPGELVEILVLDGCFLIEFFRKNAGIVKPEPDDPVFTMSCMFQHLQHDLILLENQIPWIVLDHMFSLTKKEESNLVDIVLEFFQHILPAASKSSPAKTSPPTSRHILELLRDVMISSTPAPDLKLFEDEHAWPPIPSATELDIAGITLRKSSLPGLNISFKNGVLEVSRISIQEPTESLFRNIISFEQCSHNCPPVFTSYAVLLDNLINTPGDIDLLARKEIIDNWLNPDDATRFFNKLYNDAYVKYNHYPELCCKVNKYYRKSWPSWMASLFRNYFSTPWVISSTFAAVFLLLLTFLQTFYTMKSGSGDHPK